MVSFCVPKTMLPMTQSVTFPLKHFNCANLRSEGLTKQKWRLQESNPDDETTLLTTGPTVINYRNDP